MNQKYFTAEKIFVRLAREHREKIKQFNIGDIIEWCAEIEIEVLGDYKQFARIENYKMTVTDGKCLLPCNIYRILDLLDSGRTRIFDFHNNGTFISFSEDANIVPSEGEILYMNYDGIALCPDTGYPLLLRGHEQALYWGCLFRMYEGDFMTNKITANV
jgi:hypothetical protein